MEKYFKTEKGEIVNVLGHCSEILSKYPDAKILIGTDSQNTKTNSRYSTVVVFRYANNGAHYIYNTINIPKIRDLFTRLFKECELSLEIADYITENTSYKVAGVELDYNDFRSTKSTPLISATKGWVESLNYRAILKSGQMIACKAADHCVRNK